MTYTAPSNPYDKSAVGLNSPATDVILVDITSTDFMPSRVARGISWGTAGDLVIVTLDNINSGTTRLLASGALAANVIHAIFVCAVIRSGTTAAGIKLYL